MIKEMRVLVLLVLAGFTFQLQAQDLSLVGVWWVTGYGHVFDITPDHFTYYQVTAVSCIELDETDLVTLEPDRIIAEELDVLDEEFDLELQQEGEFLVFDDGAVDLKYAERIAELPESCETGIDESDDAVDVFEVFWQTFNEHYAFFDLYGVDWDATYMEFRPRVSSDMSDDDLFEVLKAMVTPLRDGHISIESDEDEFNPGFLPEWVADEDDDILEDYPEMIEDVYLVDEPIYYANDLVSYGHLSESIGYLHLWEMSDYADDEDMEMQVLSDAMRVISEDFSRLDALVIDVRFNPGGNDQSGLFVAGYFVSEPILAFSKSARVGEGYGRVTDIFVQPIGLAAFEGDVYVLTSSYSASAAEIFVLAMRDLPQVIVLGESTNGVLSDALEVLLPNGWIFSLSNERYLTANGELFEGHGILPDIEIPMTVEDVESETDPVLDVILEMQP